MFKKIGLGLLWIGLLTYAFIFAPPQQPDTLALIKNLSTGQWQGINPLIIALFNLMGLLPMMYACLLFIDGKGQKIPAWPFATGSFFVGAFALLPYLALRQSNPNFSGEKNFFLKLLDSRLVGIFLTIGAIIFLAFGLLKGDWVDWVKQWQTSQFIHVMSLDFCCLCLLFPTLLGDDLARRGIKNPLVFWTITLVPLLGVLAYLSLRPPVREINQETLANKSTTDNQLII